MKLKNNSQLFSQDPTVYLHPPIKKDYYEIVYSHLERVGAKSVIDIGCASGDFFYFLGNNVNRKVGIDISNELIELARARVKNAEFVKSDIFDYCKKKDKFDAVCVNGTLHTFLEYEKLIVDLVLSARPKILIIQSPFNINPFDVRIMHADARIKNASYQCAYCLFSIEKLVLFLEEMGAKVNFQKYEMDSSLSKDSSSPMRNYHINIDGERCLTNGASIILREFIIVAEFEGA